MYMHYSDFVFSQHLCGDTPDHRGADAAGSGGDVSDDSLRAVHADRTAVIIHSDVEIASGGVGKGDQRFSDRRFVPGFPDSGCECVKFRQDESYAIECLSVDRIDLID